MNRIVLGDKYLIKKENQNTYIKLWYSDEVILFDSEDQVKDFIKEFPVFFEGVDYIIVVADLLTGNCVLYSDLIVDDEFNEEKKNIKPKYIIKDNVGMMVRHYKHIILFDDEEEINEFKTTFPGLFKDHEHKTVEEYLNLGWYLSIDFKNYKKTDSYKRAIKDQQITS